MFLSIIRENNINTYVYVKNNKLYGYAVNYLGVTSADRNIFNRVLRLLKGDNYKYLDNYDEYKVYIDDNNLKHFINNGIENYELFFRYNGEDFIFNYSDEKSNNCIVKKIVIGGLVIIIGVGSFLSFHNNISISGDPTITTVNAETDHSNLEIVDEEEANILIQNSSTKDILYNEQLIKVIYPYYEGTDMPYLLRQRLTDLHFRYYDLEEHNSRGYYDFTRPDTLNVLKSDENNKSIKRHEFNHLLQSSDVDEHYIREAMADIMSKEFYDNYDEGYLLTRVAYMLAVVIGPEPFYKLMYGADEEAFYSEIRPYLSEEELERFKNIMCDDPKNTKYHDEEELVKKMYYNKYHRSYTEDPLMVYLDYDLTFYEKVNFFNPYKVHDKEIIEVDEYFNDEFETKEIDGKYYVEFEGMKSRFSDQYQNLLNASKKTK